MAGADTACVPARAGTILGVTRSPAPSFRLQRAEPWLRLSVPALLGLFLVTLGVCGYFQIGNSRRDALAGAASEIEIVATLAALALGGAGDSASAETRLAALARSLPAGALPNGRMLLIAERRRRDPRGSSAGKPRTAPVERNLGRGSAAHAFRRPRRRHGDPARKRCSGACDRARDCPARRARSPSSI